MKQHLYQNADTSHLQAVERRSILSVYMWLLGKGDYYLYRCMIDEKAEAQLPASSTAIQESLHYPGPIRNHTSVIKSTAAPQTGRLYYWSGEPPQLSSQEIKARLKHPVPSSQYPPRNIGQASPDKII